MKPCRSSLWGRFFAALLVFSLWGGEAARAFNQCNFSNIVAVAFGTFNPLLGVNRDATGSFTYKCLGGFDTVTLTLSRGSSPTYTPRTLRSGANTLGYNLFTTAGRTTIWGDGSAGTSVVQIYTANNDDTVVQIFGRIPSSENPRVGTYSDTVVITIIF